MGVKFNLKGKIANRTVTCLSINRELLEKAKEKNLNISLILDAALSRELLDKETASYSQAVEKKNDNLILFLKETKLLNAYDDWKYGGNKDVLEEKETRTTTTNLRKALADFENN